MKRPLTHTRQLYLALVAELDKQLEAEDNPARREELRKKFLSVARDLVETVEADGE